MKRPDNEGSLFRSKAGWTAQVYVDGRKVRRSAKTQREAAVLLKELLKERDAGAKKTEAMVATITVRQLMDEWLTAMKADGWLRYATMRHYQSCAEHYIVPRLGDHLLSALTPRMVEAMTTDLMAKGLSRRTAAKVRTVLGTALAKAMQWEYVSRNVAQIASAPRGQRKAEKHAFSAAQVMALLDVASDEEQPALFAVPAMLGLRQGEVLGLRWSDLDFGERTLTVAQTVRLGPGRELIIEPAKNTSSMRTLPLFDTLIEMLRAERQHQREARLRAGASWLDTGLVFTNDTGRSLQPAQVLVVLKRIEARAGLPTLTYHELRHSATSVLLSLGVEPVVVSRILGHANVATTLDVYAHVFDADMREAVEKVEQAIHIRTR